MWEHYLEERDTARLLIRPLNNQDHIAWQEFILDEVATRFFPDSWKLKPERAKEWINLQLRRYQENRYGLMALVEKKSGSLIGQCGLLAQSINGLSELEIGYHLIRRYWGNGYATESARAFRNLAFENDLAESIISIIDVDNILSQNVAVRNGMSKEARTKFLDMDVCIFRITREDHARNCPAGNGHAYPG